MTLLVVDRLSVFFTIEAKQIRVVNELSYSLKTRETLGIVGESGSGKSQSVLSIIGLLAKNATTEGSVRFKDNEILNGKEATLNQIRGRDIAVIFQDPMTSLNPYLKIETQMTEVLIHHLGITRKAALNRAIAALDSVQIADAKNRIRCYPHELSGGMRQRVAIATALLCDPDLIIADEPTTALDVTTQSQILQLIKELKENTGVALIVISHDLGVIAQLCDNVLVMYAGQAMEYGNLEEVYRSPFHPYTEALLKSIPGINKACQDRLYEIPGNPPSFLDLPPGCPFSNRCEYTFEPCNDKRPDEKSLSNGRRIACYRDTK